MILAAALAVASLPLLQGLRRLFGADLPSARRQGGGGHYASAAALGLGVGVLRTALLLGTAAGFYLTR